MPRTEKYFVGPRLLGDIREVITRVNGIAAKTSGVSLPVRLQDMARQRTVFRMCQFTGSWLKSQDKTVTLRGVTTTLVVTNLFANIQGSTATATKLNCAAGRDGTAWYLIAAECL